MATKAHLDGNKRYLEKLDEIKLRLPKDGTKEKIAAYAKSRSTSVNAYILGLIIQDLESAGITLKDTTNENTHTTE